MNMSKFLKVKFILPLVVLVGAGVFNHFVAIQWSTSPVHLKEATADNIYVINLDRTPERFAPLKKQLEHFGLPFTRWSATDGYALELKDTQGKVFTGLDLKESKAQLAMNQKYTLKTGYGTLTYQPRDFLLSAGELGTSLSHMSIWNHVAHKEIPWAMIFEDDIYLEPLFQEKFSDILLNLPGGWDVVYVSTIPDPKKRTMPVLGNATLRKIGPDNRCTTGAYAYMVSHGGAKKLMAYSTHFSGAIDDVLGDAINDGTLNAYISPAPLVGLSSVPSVLDLMGRDRLKPKPSAEKGKQ